MNNNPEPKELAEKVREACISAAREGFRDASMSGLCEDGAIEAAIGAMQMLDLDKILSKKDDKNKRV